MLNSSGAVVQSESNIPVGRNGKGNWSWSVPAPAAGKSSDQYQFQVSGSFPTSVTSGTNADVVLSTSHVFTVKLPATRDEFRITVVGPEFIEIVYGNQGRFAGYDMTIKNTGSRSFKLSELQINCNIGSTILREFQSNPNLVIATAQTAAIQVVAVAGPTQKPNLPIGQVSHTCNLSLWKGGNEGTVYNTSQQMSVHNNGKKGDPVDIAADAIKARPGNASSFAGWYDDQFQANVNADTWIIFQYVNLSKNSTWYSAPYNVRCTFLEAGKNITGGDQGSTTLSENSAGRSVTYLGRLPAGTYNITCSVDPEGVLWDTNISNNKKTFAFTVQPTGVTWP